jgi:GTP cyclohydrolase-4
MDSREHGQVVHGAGLVPGDAAGECNLSTFIPEEKHQQVLGTCIDVPEEPPSFPMPLQKVGISGKTVWVSLADNRGGHIPFTARIHVNLPGNMRGIHMSRIEQAISSLHGKKFADLPAYGKLLATHILEAQNAQNIWLQLSGRMPFIQQTPVSKQYSIDSIDVSFSLAQRRDRPPATENVQVGAGVYHLTACPCTLSYNEALFNRFNDPWPQATHSQRSRTELLVSLKNDVQLPGYDTLMGILDSVLHVSQDLLKRPDETELVLKAHRHPQFVEDTVREVARAAAEKFQDALPAETRIQVNSLSLESIHIHDVECCLDAELGEILATLQSTREEQNP